jgi:hypothetical protein
VPCSDCGAALACCTKLIDVNVATAPTAVTMTMIAVIANFVFIMVSSWKKAYVINHCCDKSRHLDISKTCQIIGRELLLLQEHLKKLSLNQYFVANGKEE